MVELNIQGDPQQKYFSYYWVEHVVAHVGLTCAPYSL